MASLYDVLGVAADAPEVELRRAYHRRARVLHPDRLTDAPEAERVVAESAMRQLNAAWEVLGDPARRDRYDAARQRAQVATARRTAGEPPPGFESVADWVQTWGDVDAADAALGRRRHGPGRPGWDRPDGDDDRDDLDLDDLDDDLVTSVGVPVWFHRLTVIVIFVVLAALLIGSAYASQVTPDDELPGRRSASPGAPADGG